MTRGVFIVLEGGEGAGKSTQARILAWQLQEDGHTVTETFEPGATTAGRFIRSLLLDSAPGSIPPKAEALLFLADRAIHVAQTIRPALDRGEIVVSARFTDSTVAYQGAGRQLGAGVLTGMSGWATDSLHPDLVVVLDIDPGIGLVRTNRRGYGDRIEQETLSFHRTVREGFQRIVEHHNDPFRRSPVPTRYIQVDAARPTAVVAAEIVAAARDLINGRGIRENTGSMDGAQP